MSIISNIFCWVRVKSKPRNPMTPEELKQRIESNIERDRLNRCHHRRQTGAIENKRLMTMAIKREL